MITSLLTRRWFVITAAALALFLAVLAGTPFLIKHLARQWLLDNGGNEVQFRDVDFNPFSATLLLEDLHVKVDQETTLSFASAGLDLAWLPLLRKQIEVQSVELTGFHIVVDNRDILKIGGIHLAGASAETESGDGDASTASWLSGIDRLTLRDFHIVYRDPKLETELALDRLLLSDLAQWAPDQPAHLELTGSVNAAGIELNAELAPLAQTPNYRGTLTVSGLALERFAALARPQLEELSGKATLQSDFTVQQDQGELTLTHKGKLSLADLKLVSSAVEVNEHSLNWKGELSLSQSSGGLRVSHSGGLGIEQLKLVSDAGVIDSQSAQWDGTTAVELAGPDQQLTLQTEGSLLLGPTSADLQRPRVFFEQEQFSHQGSFSFAQGEPGPTLTASSNVELQKLRLEAQERKFKLLDVQDLRISGLEIAALDKLTVDAVQADDLYVGQSVNADTDSGKEQDASLHIAQARISKPAYADRLLSIDSIEYDGWHARLHRNTEGQWAVVRLLDVIEGLAQAPEAAREDTGQADTAATSGDAKDEPEAQPLQFAVKRIEAGRGSKLTFADESVKPVFRTELDLQQLKLENIDSRQPEQATSLVLDSKIGKYTRVALQGELRPFLQPPGLNLKGNIDAMDLPQLSSYTREGLGLVLNSGTLDADLSVQTEADKLDGKATLKLHQLQLKSVPGKDTLQSKIPVPLDTALDTLRDSNNAIQLEIPVAGNVNDPQFNVNDAISQALAKGVQKGALSYLTLALQPYGTLITAAKYAGEAATRVRLNPVEFDPGQSVLDDSDREYLDKVAKVLKDRPKIAIKLCGVAAAPDRLFIQQQQKAQQQAAQAPAAQQATAPVEATAVDETKLSEIAEQRAAAVKDYLIEQHRVQANRLVGCLPQLRLDDDKAVPRADLLI